MMKIKHLSHAHGGSITSIRVIAHETYRGVATWHYLGVVEWSDNSKSPNALIAPWALCFDHDSPEANREFDIVAKATSQYLDTQGKWHEQKEKRDGRVYGWTPHKPKGEIKIEDIKS